MTRLVLASSVALAGMLVAGAAMAQPWQYNSTIEAHAARTGDLYTTALNELYSQGFHRAHAMWLQGGMVHATALNAQGQPTTVTIDPGTGQVSFG